MSSVLGEQQLELSDALEIHTMLLLEELDSRTKLVDLGSIANHLRVRVVERVLLVDRLLLEQLQLRLIRALLRLQLTRQVRDLQLLRLVRRGEALELTDSLQLSLNGVREVRVLLQQLRELCLEGVRLGALGRQLLRQTRYGRLMLLGELAQSGLVSSFDRFCINLVWWW